MKAGNGVRSRKRAWIWLVSAALVCLLLILLYGSLKDPVIWRSGNGEVQDIHAVGNRIFWGHNVGDDDTEPSRIVSYDTRTGETELFVSSDGLLGAGTRSPTAIFFPGFDRLDNWDSCGPGVVDTEDCGSVYQCNDEGCVEYHTVSDGAHVNSVAWYRGRLYASGGNYWDRPDGTSRTDDSDSKEILDYSGTGFIYSSDDNGKSWTPEHMVPPYHRAKGFVRCTRLVACTDRLHSVCGGTWFSTSGDGNWKEGESPGCDREVIPRHADSGSYRYSIVDGAVIRQRMDSD